MTDTRPRCELTVSILLSWQVTITLESPEVGTTILKLNQTGIPVEDAFGQAVFEHTEKGWKGQIFTRIRQVFGYGI